MRTFSLKRKIVAVAAVTAAVVLPIATGGAAYAAPPTVTLTAKDSVTGSTTQTSPGSTINYVANIKNDPGTVTYTDTIPAGQTLVPASVTYPPGWTNASTASTVSVSGTVTDQTNGIYSGATSNVSLATVNTTTTGGDGYVPVPYGTKVFGAYHYTLDGYNGGTKLLWAADKATGAITTYNLGGNTVLTPWMANPTVVGSKLFVPVMKFASTPAVNSATTYKPDYGFACFDMATLALCPTAFYKMGTMGSVTTILSKGTNAVRTNPIPGMSGLGMANNGTYYMTAIQTAGAVPVLHAISFATGVPVLSSTVTMNTPNSFMFQNITADGSKLFSTNNSGGTLNCTNTATGGACAGWVAPTTAVPSGGSARISMIDDVNHVCVEDTAGAAHTTNCYNTATGALRSPTYLAGVQNIGGPEFRTDSTGERQYFGPGYTATPTILCLEDGAPCANFGTAGVAPVVGGVAGFKTYGVAADDKLPSCMWAIGDAGQLYPFDSTTGAAGCSAVTSTVNVNPNPAQWCGGGGVTGFSTLTFAGTVPSGTLHLKVLRGGVPVAGWTNKSLPASSSVDISALPYVAGAAYDLIVTFDGSAATTTATKVTMAQDPAQVCFNTVVTNSCAVASPATNSGSVSVVSGGVTSTANSNQTSLTVVKDPVLCPTPAPSIVIVKKINGNDANTSPGVTVTQGSTMNITYEVTNNGNVTLSTVKVTDDKIAAANISCPKTTLIAAETMTCTASLAAPAPGVQHTNTGSVEGTSPQSVKVTATDPANAIVPATPSIVVVKKINGDDANAAPGVTVAAGSTMNITYEVTNNGNVTLSTVKVTDDKIAAANITCPKTTLTAGESMTCTASLAAPAPGVQHTNTGSVEGTSPQNVKVTDTDPANAMVTAGPAITIVKKINGDDANTAPGVTVAAGSTMAITYEVTNSGNVTLSTVKVTDDKIAAANITCPKTTLIAGESMTCTASLAAPAPGVQHTNTGSVEGTSPQNVKVTDTDPANANVTPVPSIVVVKKINGNDANTTPGVNVPAGSSMAVTFEVTNNGNVTLSSVSVTDDKIAAANITCPKTTLIPAETMTCTASLAAPAPGVQHTNTGSVEGTSPQNVKVTDTDPANANVTAVPSIVIVKKINGNDADTTPGVTVAQGSSMAITYEVTNNGNVTLATVKVTDDKIAAANITCPKTTLTAGESMTCTASLAAPAPGVQHTNTGSVEGTSPQNVKVTDTDPANANVTPVPGITVVKKINGNDANAAPGVTVVAGSTMSIAYEVTNSGNVSLSGVSVTDDKVATANISCPKTTLAAGETMTCTASLAAPAPGVQHTNTGSVEGTSPQNVKVTDTDPANAMVTAAPSIVVVKKINGDDANSTPGVTVTQGSSMAVTFEVTNNGNVTLSSVSVTDDKIAAANITCPKTTLIAGESMTCTASLAAPAPGVQHTNTGSVEGTSPQNVKVTDTDPANAMVTAGPAITIVKKINGDDANTAPGVTVAAGSTMAITYEVTNSGNVTLSTVKVTDDKIAAANITCPKTTLIAGESMTCTASLAAPAPGVQHTNTGSVEGTSPQNVKVTDTDPANANVAVVKIALSGTIWYDADRSAQGTFTNIKTGAEVGTPAGGMTAALTDSSGNVLKVVSVGLDGTYSFADVPLNSSLKVVIVPSTGAPAVGDVVVAGGLNTAWFGTTPLVRPVTTVDVDVTDQDFGVVQVKATVTKYSGGLCQMTVMTSICEVGGSTFALYIVDPATPGATPVTNGITADVAGGARFTTEFLSAGVTYWIVETKAPDGHNLLAAPIRFTADTSGVVLASPSQIVSLDPGDSFRVRVFDVEPLILPTTGGDGPSLMWLLGLSLIGAALVIRASRYRARHRMPFART